MLTFFLGNVFFFLLKKPLYINEMSIAMQFARYQWYKFSSVGESFYESGQDFNTTFIFL